ncbi:MAG: lipopolysaccharide heptosyltransferase II [Syntrophorhabdales bacterium]
MTGKTIIYLPNWIGDMVMATPFLQSLRDSLDGEMWGVGKPSAMHLYNGLNLFNRFIPYDGKSVVGFLDLVSTIAGGRFERGIVLPHSFRSALLFFLGSVKKRIGYSRNSRRLMLHTVVEEHAGGPEPTVEHYLRILDALPAKRTVETPLLRVTDDEDRKFDERFTDVAGGYVVFIVGAQYGPAKRWPETHFSSLADMLAERFAFRVYLLPGKGEEEIARRVYDGVRNKERVELKLMDVRELKVCLARASVVVSNDTGPRHMAAALCVPTVVILGPMDERYTFYPTRFSHVLYKDVPCRPCNNKRCDRDHECLKGVSPEGVFREIEEVLGGRRAADRPVQG